jgi:hypothetical protein
MQNASVLERMENKRVSAAADYPFDTLVAFVQHLS